MSEIETEAFHHRVERVEALVQEIEQKADPAVREAAQEMVRVLLEVHGAGLARLLGRLSESGEAGRTILDDCIRDELLESLLKLHGLHPQDLHARVTDALEKVRPYLQSHGGEVELLSVEAGVARLRLHGSCDGCPSSSATLKSMIEQAVLEAAPEVVRVEAEQPSSDTEGEGLVQLGLPSREQK